MKPRVLTVAESLRALQKAKVPVLSFHLAKNEAELEKSVKKTGFPCVLKAVSKKAVHKTEFKAVRLNIQSLKDAKKHFSQLKKIPGFESALVQKQIDGTELFIGSKKDTQFGSTIVFGIGGVLVELLKDASIRINPITASDAQSMVREIRHQNVLNGFRGKPKANPKQIVHVLLQTSKLIQKLSPQELDINPLIATRKGIFAVDARIIL